MEIDGHSGDHAFIGGAPLFWAVIWFGFAVLVAGAVLLLSMLQG